MARSRVLVPAIACLALGALAPAAWGAASFHARIAGALGIVPAFDREGQVGAHDVASGQLTPVTYHGGQTMTGGITVHCRASPSGTGVPSSLRAALNLTPCSR